MSNTITATHAGTVDTALICDAASPLAHPRKGFSLWTNGYRKNVSDKVESDQIDQWR